MMRRALTLAVAVVMTMGAPAALLAQSPLSSGSVAGRAVDAAGRSVAGQRVELLRGTLVIAADTTSSRGEWSFHSVAAGDYIVRMNVRGKIAGMRLSVGVGQAVAGNLIVVPTATVSAQLGSLASLLTMLPTAAAAVTSTTIAGALEVETVVVDEVILTTILTQLSPTARQAFVEELLDAIENDDSGTNGYSQYQEQLEEIRDDPAAEIPVFPPPHDVS